MCRRAPFICIIFLRVAAVRIEFLRVAISSLAGVFNFGRWNALYQVVDTDRLHCEGGFSGNMLELLFLIQPVVLLKGRRGPRVVAGLQTWLLYSSLCKPDQEIPVLLISGLHEDALSDLIVADTILRAGLALKKGSALGLMGQLWREAEPHINAPSIWALISHRKFSYRVLAEQLGTSTTTLAKGGDDEDRG